MLWTRRFDLVTCVHGLMFLSNMALWADTTSATSNIHASGCTGQEIHLSCPQQHKIAIKRVFYGVKKGWDCRPDTPKYRSEYDLVDNDVIVKVNTSDCCRTSNTDCQLDDDSMYPPLNTKCSGYMSCDLEVQRIHTRDPCRYKSYTDYMAIIYDCISVGDIAAFCSDDIKRGKSLYLANVEYPAAIRPHPQDDECQCSIRTTHPQGIGIHTIDVLLAWADIGPMECRRNLRIQDPMAYRRDIQCANRGYYGFKSIYSRPVSNVTVTLSTFPGEGMAFVWLQAKPNDADGMVEIVCGQSLQDLLHRIRLQSESRQRQDIKKEENVRDDSKSDAGQVVDNTKKTSNGTSVAATAGSRPLNSDLAVITGGIVTAGFVLIAVVIIAVALHCRRARKKKRLHDQLEMQPTVNTELLDLNSYCRYDCDDDNFNSMNRSPLKVALLKDDESLTNSFKSNGFTTIPHTGECQIHREITPPLPPGFSTPPPSSHNQHMLAGRSYREVHYPGDVSLRFVKPLVSSSKSFTDIDMHPNGHHHPEGHTTLPVNRKTVLIPCGPKSPLGKRSKSVSFSQPVAMVTPLNSESEESMEKPQINSYLEDPSYDNLNKLDIPNYPIIPGKTELVKIPRWDKEYREDNPLNTRPLTSFQNTSGLPAETKVFITTPFDLNLNSDPNDSTYISDSPSIFWNSTGQNGKPLLLPKPQKADLYETGV